MAEATKGNVKRTPKRAPKPKTEPAPVVEPEVVESPLANGDLIPCLNVFPGSLLIFGKRSGTPYRFDAPDSIEYILYEDLKAEALNRRSLLLYDPQIMIKDERFLKEFPRLNEVYEEAYTNSKLVDLVLDKPAKSLKKIVEGMPEDVLDKMKAVVATLVADGDLDSRTKLQVLDELLDTDFSSRG